MDSLWFKLILGREPALGLDPRWLEAASGSAAVLWGAMLLLQSSAPSYRPYAPLGAFISDPLLAWLFVTGGTVQLAAVLQNHPLARIPVAAAMASAWLLVTYSAWLGAPGSPTIALLLAFGGWNVMAMLALIRLAGRP